jgi:outer membrane scaffolding protein for murein synthesis (MipA/OmpV family)
VYGSKRQHAYFYSVEDRYATASRPAYGARGGYAGWQILGSLSKRFPKFWIGGFIRYDSLRGAVFEDSPLVDDSNYIAAGFGFAWIVAESRRRVVADD